MRVLIAEDESTSRLLLKRYLNGLSHADVVENGRQAVEAFRQALGKGEPYDVVLLDIEMPLMNGHQVLMAIREMEDLRDVGKQGEAKVFMITASSDQRNVCDAFFKGGATGYMVKPVARAALLRTIGMTYLES